MVRNPSPIMALNEYERALGAHRAGCRERPVLRALFDPELDPRLMLRFLIVYCARGVRMTAPVSGWIERAGARCQELGWVALGTALSAHARHEAGHDRLFVNDVERLVQRYNRDHLAQLDPADLLEQPATPAVVRYVALHERTIAGPAPYAQVAIELEIEALSVDVGAPLLRQIEQRLDASVLECLSFLSEHVALDAGHTALNRRLLSELLGARPEALDVLVETGRLALDTYLDFLSECFEAARVERELPPS